MRRWVTVRVTAITVDTVTVTLSDHYNERTRKFCASVKGLELTQSEFASLASDHGLTLADFPIGKPIRVWESA